MANRNTPAATGSQATPDPPVPPESTPIVAPEPAQPFPDPIPGVIPFGALVVFGGLQRIGKTTLMGQWCAAWTAGEPILDHKTNAPVEIAYLALDRSWERYQELFTKFGLPDLKHYAVADDPSFPMGEFTRNPTLALNLCLDRLNPAPGALVFIDPVSPLCIHGNPNDARAVALSMHAIRRIAKARQITIMCLVHFHKPKEDDKLARGIDQIAGSGAFSGYSDVQMYLLHQQPGQDHQVFGWNPIALPAEDFQLRRNEQGLFVPQVYDELSQLLASKEDKGNQVYGLIPEEANAAPTKTVEVAAQAKYQIPRATFFRILAKLERLGLISRQKPGYLYRRKSN